MIAPTTIVRAWKDPLFRETLTAEERALLPDHPAGAVELSDSELDRAAGGIDIDWTTILDTIFGSFRQGTKYSCCTIQCGGSSQCTKDPTCRVKR